MRHTNEHHLRNYCFADLSHWFLEDFLQKPATRWRQNSRNSASEKCKELKLCWNKNSQLKFFFFASHTEKHIEGVENISILTKWINTTDWNILCFIIRKEKEWFFNIFYTLKWGTQNAKQRVKHKAFSTVVARQLCLCLLFSFIHSKTWKIHSHTLNKRKKIH